MTTTAERLHKFAQYCQKLQGDEKGEAQVFLDRWFQAFGHEGAIDAGAVFEERIKAENIVHKSRPANLE